MHNRGKTMHYYKLNISDYITDTYTLNQNEHGAYMLLINHYYKTEKRLPKDFKQCCAIALAREDYECNAVQRILDQFFEKTLTGYQHKRIDKEIKVFHSYINQSL